MEIKSDTVLIIDALDNDEKVRSLAWLQNSPVDAARLRHVPSGAEGSSVAPEPRKLAKALTKETLLDKDAEYRCAVRIAPPAGASPWALSSCYDCYARPRPSSNTRTPPGSGF